MNWSAKNDAAASVPTLEQLRTRHPPWRWPVAGSAPAPSQARVLLVAGDADLRQRVAADLQAHDAITLVADAADLREARARTSWCAVDVLLLVLPLRTGSLVEALLHLQASGRAPRTLVLSPDSSDDLALQALTAGAAGWICLRDWQGSYAGPVLHVAEGGLALGDEHARRWLQLLRPVRADGTATVRGQLTTREGEVLALVAQGLRSREIAARLAICIDTVDAHVQSACRKLQVRSRAQAVRLASQLGLV